MDWSFGKFLYYTEGFYFLCFFLIFFTEMGLVFSPSLEYMLEISETQNFVKYEKYTKFHLIKGMPFTPNFFL